MVCQPEFEQFARSSLTIRSFLAQHVLIGISAIFPPIAEVGNSEPHSTIVN